MRFGTMRQHRSLEESRCLAHAGRRAVSCAKQELPSAAKLEPNRTPATRCQPSADWGQVLN